MEHIAAAGENSKTIKTQEEQWQRCLRWALEKDPLFQQRCEKTQITADGLLLCDLGKLPLQADTIGESPFKQLTIPLSGVARILGTTTYMPEEITVWEDCSERWQRACGVNKASVLLIADGFDGEGPAWGLLRGGEKVGAVIITGADQPWNKVMDYSVTACALTAELLDRWTDSGNNGGTCQAFFCLTSGVGEADRNRWQQVLGAPVYLQLGLPGVQASAIAWECRRRQGYHWMGEYFLPEILDAKQLPVMTDGMAGDLVLTALQRYSMTAIRRQTAWQGAFSPAACPCGVPGARFLSMK